MRTCILAGAIVCSCLASFTPTFAGSLSPTVEEWLEEADSDDSVVVWVFFTDKGEFDWSEKQQMLQMLAQSYDPRARERRLRADPLHAFDEADLPLYRPYLKGVEACGVRFRSFSRWLNAVSIVASPLQIEAIASLRYVRYIDRVSGCRTRYEPEAKAAAMTRGAAGFYGQSYRQLEQIQVTDLHAAGYTGSGIRIAVFDTGFWLEHEALLGVNVFAEHDFINDDGETANEPGDDPHQHYHGTSVLSAIGGYSPDKLIGPAYGAEYVLAKTEDISIEQPIEEDWWIEACEWADSLGADIITSSLCYKDWYTYEDMDGDTAPITIAADRAVLKGIVVTNAAGNSGASSWRYILAPADGDSVISVGSVDSSGVRSSWSSQGPTYDGRIKPTIMAMGEATYIASADSTQAYIHGYGTSFATPLVAGAIALVLEKNPVWMPPQIIESIKMTATQAASPDTFYGWGILQAYDASNYDVSGVKHYEFSSLSVYPNPTEGIVHLSPGDEIASKFYLYDVRGRLLGSLLIDHDSAIDLRTMLPRKPVGVVFLKSSKGASAKIVVR